MLQFFPIDTTGRVDSSVELPEPVREACAATAGWYACVGYSPPWCGYLAQRDGVWIGACAFKTAPQAGRVEIAYGVFPGWEGQGLATEMARWLVDLAGRQQPGILVTAQTLPQEGASPAILRKLGFQLARTVEHPEDGTVWEWERA